MVLDVADITDPAKALWSALGGKIQLTDVIVTLDLTYSDANALTLTGTASVQGNFLLDTIALSEILLHDRTWSPTADPNLSLSVLDDIGCHRLRLAAVQQPAARPAWHDRRLPAQLSPHRRQRQHVLLAEFTFAITSSRPWTLIPGVLELSSLQIRLTIDGTPSVTGMVLGVLGCPRGRTSWSASAAARRRNHGSSPPSPPRSRCPAWASSPSSPRARTWPRWSRRAGWTSSTS